MGDAVELLAAYGNFDAAALSVWSAADYAWLRADAAWIDLGLHDTVCIYSEWIDTAVANLSLSDTRAQCLVADLSKCRSHIAGFQLDRKLVLGPWTLI